MSVSPSPLRPAPRLYCDGVLSPGAVVELSERATRHVHALRLHVGDALVLFNGDGTESAAVLTGIAKRGAHGFGMKVVYHNRSRLSAELEAECKASYVSKEELLRTADHVMLVVPYTAASHHTIGASELALMKPTATLINIARGGIVDDAALALALRERRIAAAGLDVFEGEPNVHPDLLTVPNVVLTPHIASATVPTRRAMANLAADNLIAFFGGQGALTPVNKPASARV